MAIQGLKHLRSGAVRKISNLLILEHLNGSPVSSGWSEVIKLSILFAPTPGVVLDVLTILDEPQLIHVVPSIIEPSRQKPDVSLPLSHLFPVSCTHNLSRRACIKLSDNYLGSTLFEVLQILKCSHFVADGFFIYIFCDRKLDFSTYHFHVDSLFGEFPVHDKLHLVVLELVLEGGHVVTVLRPVLGQCRHLPPSQLLKSRDVGVSRK